MINDLRALEGKITALAPSWELMAEFTGKPSSATMLGLYVKHFVEQRVAMADVNLAVEQILVGWKRGFWPSPEEIVARAKEIARQARGTNEFRDISWQIDEACAQEDARKWEHRLHIANAWREGNMPRFKILLATIDGDIKHLKDVVKLAWMAESQSYRDAFRVGASVGACIRQAGIDERKQAKIDAQERERRAAQFAATGAVGERAA